MSSVRPRTSRSMLMLRERPALAGAYDPDTSNDLRYQPWPRLRSVRSDPAGRHSNAGMGRHNREASTAREPCDHIFDQGRCQLADLPRFPNDERRKQNDSRGPRGAVAVELISKASFCITRL